MGLGFYIIFRSPLEDACLLDLPEILTVARGLLGFFLLLLALGGRQSGRLPS